MLPAMPARCSIFTDFQIRGTRREDKSYTRRFPEAVVAQGELPDSLGRRFELATDALLPIFRVSFA